MKKGLLLLLLLALQGCAPYYLVDSQLSGLQPGLNMQQVQGQLAKKPSAEFPVTGLDGLYAVQVYHVLTDQTQQMTVSCGQYGCIPIMYTEPVTEPFAFVFQDDKLIAWGFVDALRKHPNGEINRVGAAVAVELQKRGNI